MIPLCLSRLATRCPPMRLLSVESAIVAQLSWRVMETAHSASVHEDTGLRAPRCPAQPPLHSFDPPNQPARHLGPLSALEGTTSTTELLSRQPYSFDTVKVQAPPRRPLSSMPFPTLSSSLQWNALLPMLAIILLLDQQPQHPG